MALLVDFRIVRPLPTGRPVAAEYNRTTEEACVHLPAIYQEGLRAVEEIPGPPLSDGDLADDVASSVIHEALHHCFRDLELSWEEEHHAIEVAQRWVGCGPEDISASGPRR